MKIKYTYSISKNPYTNKYTVFKENEEHFICVGIFSSISKKDCLEYIKNMNKRKKTK